MKSKIRTVVFRAAHAVVDKASEVIAEDLRRPIPAHKKRGKKIDRRLSAWTKGVEAEALSNVSERRGSALTLVNAAYTSQVAPCCGAIGRRSRDRLDCTRCGVVWQADHAAAINIEQRKSGPDIGLYTPTHPGQTDPARPRSPTAQHCRARTPAPRGGERTIILGTTVINK